MKAKIVLALAICASLTGCLDPIVRKQATGLSYETRELVECRYAGYCYTNFYDPQRGYFYGYGYSYNCPGTQRVTIRHTPMEYEYASGGIRHLVREEVISQGICR